jgi:hypothetical protein
VDGVDMPDDERLCNEKPRKGVIISIGQRPMGNRNPKHSATPDGKHGATPDAKNAVLPPSTPLHRKYFLNLPKPMQLRFPSNVFSLQR